MEILLSLAILAGLSVVVATIFYLCEWLSGRRERSERGKSGK